MRRENPAFLGEELVEKLLQLGQEASLVFEALREGEPDNPGVASVIDAFVVGAVSHACKLQVEVVGELGEGDGSAAEYGRYHSQQT